jgi:hypothetical protein
LCYCTRHARAGALSAGRGPMIGCRAGLSARCGVPDRRRASISLLKDKRSMMPNIARTSLGRTLLIGATVALSIGTSAAAFAQPGSSFQTRGQRESDGDPAVPTAHSRVVNPPEAYREWNGVSPPGYAWYPYGGSYHYLRYDRLVPQPSHRTPQSWYPAEQHR